MCGRNRRVFRRVERLEGVNPIVPLAFVENIADLMVASDVLLTKTGGVTLAEAFCCGLPVLAFDPLPGQEEGNARYAVECGAAELATSPSHLASVGDGAAVVAGAARGAGGAPVGSWPRPARRWRPPRRSSGGSRSGRARDARLTCQGRAMTLTPARHEVETAPRVAAVRLQIEARVDRLDKTARITTKERRMQVLERLHPGYGIAIVRIMAGIVLLSPATRSGPGRASRASRDSSATSASRRRPSWRRC